MKRLIAMIFAFIFTCSLFGCALQGTNRPIPPRNPGIAEPEPQEQPSQQPEEPSDRLNEQEKPEDQPVAEPVITITEQTLVDQLGGHTVTITTPVADLQNPTAAEIINQYFSLLSGKVRDYAEGDLSAMNGVTCTVTAEYRNTWTSGTVLSFLWTVDTVTNSPELPGSSTIVSVNFDPTTGRILTFRDLFGDNSAAIRGQFVTRARNLISQQLSNHYYYDDWSELVAITATYLPQEMVALG